MVQSGPTSGVLTVTTTSHRLFGALTIEHPAARVLAQLLASRQERGADGGLLTIMLACSIVLGASRRRLPPRLCAALLPEMFSIALRMVLDGSVSAPSSGASGLRYLPTAAPVRMSDLRCLLSLVSTVLRPKHVAVPSGGGDDPEQLALLLVKCFVQSLSDGAPAHVAPIDDDGNDEGPPSPPARRAAAFLPGACTPRHASAPLMCTPLGRGTRAPPLASSLAAGCNRWPQPLAARYWVLAAAAAADEDISKVCIH